MLSEIKLANSRVLNLHTKPVIMGILNVTPDSFYDGGKYSKVDDAIEHAYLMMRDGAEIIDIGGASTRPGSDPVPLRSELERVIPIVEQLSKSGAIISVDTYKSEVAEDALKKGAHIINDISGCTFDNRMVDVLKSYSASVIIMHMKGRPKDMQMNPQYGDVIIEISNWLSERLRTLVDCGIKQQSIILDPGIGFGKTAEHNMTILKNIQSFKSLGQPVLIGLSRKSFLGHYTGLTNSHDRLVPTIVAHTLCILQDVDILRVHDVREVRYTSVFVNAYKKVRR